MRQSYFLDRGVLEWAVLIAAVDQFDEKLIQNHPLLRLITKPTVTYSLNPTFWKAHNASLREGVRRADAAGLRSKEPVAEQAFINIMLYNVLEPGDQCASGETAFCDFMITPALDFGSKVLYPQKYPATWDDVNFTIDAFNNLGIWGMWVVLGARLPSEIHMVKPLVETQ